MQSHIHVLADGAVWIDTQRRVAFGVQGELLIDLYHVMEYLGEAAASCSSKTTRWLKNQKKRLKAGRSDKVITELKKHLEPATEPDELRLVRRAWRYLDNRRDYLAYDQAIKKELPLGSGLIESGNKYVLQARMKIPGASWNIETAEDFAKARALREQTMESILGRSKRSRMNYPAHLITIACFWADADAAVFLRSDDVSHLSKVPHLRRQASTGLIGYRRIANHPFVFTL